MNKIFLVLAVTFLIGGVASAKDDYWYNSPLEWKSPMLMGQGGSSTANVRGYEALFTNPAGFRTEKGEFNIMTLQAGWDGRLFRFSETLDQQDFWSAVLEQLNDNGFGAGFQSSFGYVGKGLGLGGFVSFDLYFPKVETVAGVSGDALITFGLVGGYALDFELGDWDLRVGADIRPMYRYFLNDFTAKTLLESIVSQNNDGEGEETSGTITLPYLQGFGFGFDFGVQADYKFLTLGLSLRDIATNFFFYDGDMTIKGGSIDMISRDISATKYSTPMTLRLGAAVNPDLGDLSKILDPLAHVEMVLPMVNDEDFIDYKFGSLWTKLNFGVELTLLSFAALRAGLNGGYPTLGFGFDLPVFKMNFALYGQEKGTYAGNSPSVGGGLEFSFRL